VFRSDRAGSIRETNPRDHVETWELRREQKRMRSTMSRVLLVAGLLGLYASVADGGALRHLRLVKAEPAADSTITLAPAEIRLFFSEAPVLTGTTIRVVSVDQKVWEVNTPAKDAKDAKIVHAAFKAAPTPGVYTVSWRTSARDGHVIRGDFKFTYSAADIPQPAR
jgi:methionine-rich copper-binding protein CopC